MVIDSSLEGILNRNSALFEEGLGTLKRFEAKICVDSEATPRYCLARSVPYSMQEKVETELSRLVQEGTLEPVQTAEWEWLF